MTLAQLIPIALHTSIFAIVFALGLGATAKDATWALRNPPALGRVVLAMFVIMPAVAVAMALAFDLPPAVKIALVALALSPIPPILPKKELKAGGETSRVFGLLVAAAALAIVVIPVGLSIVGRITGFSLSLPESTLLQIVGMTVFIPLALGLLLHRVAPALAERIAGPIGKVGALLLVFGVLPILITAGPGMWSLIGDGTLIAIVAFQAIGLVAGHFLAGGRGEDRTVLALSTASRHPGVALAIASANFPEQRLAAPAVLLYLLVGAVVSGVYLALRRKAAAKTGAASAAG